MKSTLKLIIAGMLLMIILPFAKGQKAINDDKLMQARRLLNDYRDASLFGDMITGKYDPSWESIFRNCFADGARIVFDVPFRPDSTLKSTESPTIRQYLELVSIDDYIAIIRSGYDTYKITDFSFGFSEIAFDTTDFYKTSKLKLVVRKSFADNPWSVAGAMSYYIEMDLSKEQPKITAIRPVDENISRSNVSLTFVNSGLGNGDPGYYITDMVSRISIEFDESINRKFIVKTDQSGRAEIGLMPNRALVKIDTVTDNFGNRFSIPRDWEVEGKRVNSQPSQGFVVPLQPWKWNGFTWSVRGFGGMIGQSENQLSNFTADSNFENNTGYQYGFGIELVKFFSLRQVLNQFGDRFKTTDAGKIANRRIYFVGGGIGISYYQYRYTISGDGFSQNPYDYLDRLGTPVDVLVSGFNYDEVTESNGVILPVFAELRRVFPNKNQYLQALSVQAGANLIIPFETSYEINGTFSRHGLYEQFNPQPVTDDPFYNYYTDLPKKIDQNFEQNEISTSLMLRFSSYFDIFGQKSDNLLDVSLLLSFPVGIISTNQNDNFYLATGNDEFSSISSSKRKVYNYFIGLSFGYNFITYSVY